MIGLALPFVVRGQNDTVDFTPMGSGYTPGGIRDTVVYDAEHGDYVKVRMAGDVVISREYMSFEDYEDWKMEELMRYVRENLSPMEQNAFRLRYLKEMTCQEVAEALNVSRQTVHTHLKQSVEKIRKFFNSSEKQYDD